MMRKNVMWIAAMLMAAAVTVLPVSAYAAEQESVSILNECEQYEETDKEVLEEDMTKEDRESPPETETGSKNAVTGEKEESLPGSEIAQEKDTNRQEIKQDGSETKENTGNSGEEISVKEEKNKPETNAAENTTDETTKEDGSSGEPKETDENANNPEDNTDHKDTAGTEDEGEKTDEPGKEVSVWITDEAGRKYYINENGEKAHGWTDVDGKRYFMDEEGVPVTGWTEADGKTYYFDADGVMKTGFIKDSEKTYYCGEDGARLSGWQDIGNETYCFDQNGEMLTGLIKSGRRSYYCAEDGKRLTGWQTINGKKYYFTDEHCRIYDNTNEGMMLTGWKTVNGRKYYFMDERYKAFDPSAKGSMMRGWKTVNGKRYYFMDNRYKVFNSSMEGTMVTGWKTIEDRTYYFTDSRMKGTASGSYGSVAEGIRTVNNDIYCFRNGIPQKNKWVKTAKSMYYFRPNGKAYKGWIKKGKQWVFMKNNGTMKTGWTTRKGKTCYITKDGKAKTGWLSLNGKRYFLGTNGVMRTGWLTKNGKKYYFGKKGAMYKKANVIGKNIYYFGTNGALNRMYTREAGKYFSLSKTNKKRAIVIIGNFLEAADKGEIFKTLHPDTNISLKDYEKIKEVVTSIYYREPLDVYRYSPGQERTAPVTCRGIGGVLDGKAGEIRILFSGRFIKDDIERFNRFRKMTDDSLKKAGVTQYDSERRKVEKIRDHVLRTLDYDWDLYEGRSDRNSSYDRIYGTSDGLMSVVKDRKGVCADYAEYFYALCTKAGVRCRVIHGSADGGSHAWNQVMVNGRWKYLDCTWIDTAETDEYDLSDYLWGDHNVEYVLTDNIKYIK